MFKASLVVGGMDRSRFGEALSDQTFGILLGSLVALNESLLRSFACHGLRLPHPYETSLRYEREPPPQEEWLDIIELYERGVGDCEDLAAALAAWLRVYEGKDAHAAFARRTVHMPEVGPVWLFHCFVVVDGRILDPSKRLGMSSLA